MTHRLFTILFSRSDMTNNTKYFLWLWAVITIPALIIAGFYGWEEHKLSKQIIQQQIDSISEKKVQMLQQFVIERQMNLAAFSRTPAVLNITLQLVNNYKTLWEHQNNSYQRNFLQCYKEFSQILGYDKFILVDSQGVIAATNHPGFQKRTSVNLTSANQVGDHLTSEPDTLNEIVYKLFINTINQPLLGNSAISVHDNRATVWLAVPLIDNNINYGIMIVTLNSVEIANLLRLNWKFPNLHEVSILHQDPKTNHLYIIGADEIYNDLNCKAVEDPALFASISEFLRDHPNNNGSQTITQPVLNYKTLKEELSTTFVRIPMLNIWLLLQPVGYISEIVISYLFLGLSIITSIILGLFLSWITIQYLPRSANQIKHSSPELTTKVSELEKAMGEKNRFIANLSHEIRTPLNAIIGYSDLLMEDRNQHNKTLIHDLEKINVSANHLLMLINDVIDLSQIESGKMIIAPELFDVKKTIDNASSLVEPIVKRNKNNLEIVCDPELGMMYSDATKIRQSITNLLSNAAKFTQSGIITFEAQRIKGTHPEGHDDIICCIVTDSGIGMTQEQLNRIFKEFSQAEDNIRKKFGGSGLGLVLTKKFVEILGGSITVASTYGKGTQFTIHLPAHFFPKDGKFLQ